jgi:GNAT superfamily N-acetyltransferase
MSEEHRGGYDIEHHTELSIDPETQRQLAELLDVCFPDTFSGRTYYKQLPYARLLLRCDGELAGQAGMDFRVIRVGDQVLRALGVIDLCVAPRFRGQKRAGALLDRVAKIAEQGRADFQILFADEPALYVAKGYLAVEPARMSWLAIEDRASRGVVAREMGGVFMVRPVGSASFPKGAIDLLGYLF